VSKIIFRKEALKKLNSPDQVDEMVVMTAPKGWLFLIGCLMLVAAATLWAFLAYIPVRVEGYGILLISGRLTEVASNTDGLIWELNVQEGQKVKKDDLLMHIQLPNSKQRDIRSPVDGVISEIMNTPIAHIKNGDPLFIISPQGDATKDLTATVFVGTLHGKQIKPGMPAQIEVSTVRKESHGYMLGQVASISILPSSSAMVSSKLKIPELVDYIRHHVEEPPFYVSVKPDLVPGSITGYAWSGPEPREPLDRGILVRVFITIAESHPIDFVVPFFERMVLGG